LWDRFFGVQSLTKQAVYPWAAWQELPWPWGPCFCAQSLLRALVVATPWLERIHGMILPYIAAFLLFFEALGTCPVDDFSTFREGLNLLGEALEPSADWPGPDVPRDLRELWLRFHESELCLGLDVVFVFNQKGAEIWCLVEEERDYRRFAELVDRLRKSRSISLYVTRPSADKKSTDREDPPPSLWNNDELRRYLQDPLARGYANTISDRLNVDNSLGPDFMLRQRMLMFAAQTLDWQKKLLRYALDIQTLAPVAYGAGAAVDLKARSAAVCLMHAQGIAKYAEKLTENLTHALPQTTKQPPILDSPKDAPTCNPLYCAYQLSFLGRTVARRIHRFIHPREHSIDLSDLRDPSLLESLRALRRSAAAFERQARK
jgi:hypothetical protein